MKCHKTTAFHYFLGFAVLTVAMGLFAVQTPAQNALLSFSNWLAISANDDGILKRPRIVGETKTVKINSEPANASNLAATINGLERIAFNILNRKRAENGLSQLTWNEDMARVARAHSQEMAQYKFFSHAGRNGSMVNDRAESFGFKRWKAIGENIAYNRGFEHPAEFACERWMQSVSHRENILSPRWEQAGIGVAINADGTHYFTEVFIVPR